MKLPKNFGGKGFGGMLQEMQGAMARAQQLEEELKRERFEIDKGEIKVVFDGRGELVSIKLDPEVVDPEDVEALEDLITGAIRDGFNQATEMREKRTNEVVGKIPGLDQLGLGG